MSFAVGIASNVLANIIFWIIVGGAAWSAASISHKRFLSFFQIRGGDAPCAYLSNLWTPEQSSRPIGFAISLHELRAAQAVGRLFGSASLRLPSLARGLVDELWIRRVVEPVILPSPLTPSEVSVCGSSIVVGSAKRNTVREMYLGRGLPFLALGLEIPASTPGGLESTAVIVQRGAKKGQTFSAELNLAVLEKVRDADSGVAVFFCAGVRGDSSWAVTEYLTRNWKHLSHEFGEQGFAICLGFPGGDNYLERYVEPMRLAAFST